MPPACGRESFLSEQKQTADSSPLSATACTGRSGRSDGDGDAHADATVAASTLHPARCSLKRPRPHQSPQVPGSRRRRARASWSSWRPEATLLVFRREWHHRHPRHGLHSHMLSDSTRPRGAKNTGLLRPRSGGRSRSMGSGSPRVLTTDPPDRASHADTQNGHSKVEIATRTRPDQAALRITRSTEPPT